MLTLFCSSVIYCNDKNLDWLQIVIDKYFDTFKIVLNSHAKNNNNKNKNSIQKFRNLPANNNMRKSFKIY